MTFLWTVFGMFVIGFLVQLWMKSTHIDPNWWFSPKNWKICILVRIDSYTPEVNFQWVAIIDGDLHEVDLASPPLPHNSLKPNFSTKFHETMDEKPKFPQKFCVEGQKFDYFKDFRAFFQKKNQNPKILTSEKNFCLKKAAFWCVLTFWKKN